MMKRKTELSKKVLLSVLAAGVMSTCVMGSALAKDKYVEPERTTYGDIYYSTNIDVKDAIFSTGTVETTNGLNRTFFAGGQFQNVDFIDNVNVSDGPNGGAIYTYDKKQKRTFTVNGGSIANNGVKNKDNVTSLAINSAALGGGIFSKGTILNLNDTVINNNYADGNGVIAAGGALLIDAISNTYNGNHVFYDSVANVNVTKDMQYVGNEVRNAKEGFFLNSYGALMQSGGGFAYLDRTAKLNFDVADGATLTIGDASSNDMKDSIASSIPLKENTEVQYAVVSKNGKGTLVLNGGLNKYYGLVKVENGTMTVNSDWVANNAISIASGAKLNLQDVTLNSFGGDNAVNYTDTDGSSKTTKVNEIKGSITTAAGSTLTAKDIVVKAGSIQAAGNVTADSLVVNDGAVEFNGNSDTEYSIANKLTADKEGQITLSGGTLKADNLKALTNGSAEKGIQLTDNGVISTTSNQVFANAASANEKATGGTSINTIYFKGGTLSLNDAEYTLAYAQDAGKQVASTKVVMTGKLAEVADSKISVDDASKVGDNVALDKVTADAGKNLLVGSDSNSIGSVETGDGGKPIAVEYTVKNGFAVGALNLAADSTGVVITNDKEVTLGGSQGGSLITVAGQDKEVKVVVGTPQDIAGVTSKAGNLNIGNSLATANTQYKLNGEVIVNEDSNLNVNGTTEITKSLTLNNGAVSVNAGSLTTDELNVKDVSNLFGEVNANKLNFEANVGTNNILAIGDNEDAGKLTVKDATLNGGMLFLDPAFKDGATISDASGVAVTNASTLDGAYVAGQNSKLSFGADLKTAEDTFAKTGETWGADGVTAAAYVAKSVALDSTKGSLTIDGSMTSAPATAITAGTVNFADKSLLMVDGAETTSNAAITGVTAATVADTSKLYIDNAKKGETYKILEGSDNGWKDDNIISSSSLLKFAGDTDTDNAYNVTASVQSVKDAFGGEVIAPKAYDAALNATGENAASDFIMNAADSKVNATKAAQVSALNSAAAMSELAGVSHGTYAASNLLTDAVSDHMSLANAKEHDSDIWAKYIHTKENIDGLSVASFGADYDAQYNGIVVGADLYKNGKATVGAALTYVDGNINGNTLAARTKNDATYYGASIYGGIASDDSAVIGDISYLHGKNDITQYNSGATLTADAKSDALSIGIRAEKSVKAGVGKFVPYAGIRYMHLGTGNYTNSIGMAYDADDMNLWLLPVGVKYSADVKAGSWTIRPIAEVGYVWNMGDRDTDQTVSLNGASDGFGYDVTDSGSYIGRFMIEAEKANVTYGLGYEYQKGDSVKANRWMANLNWNF